MTSPAEPVVSLIVSSRNGMAKLPVLFGSLHAEAFHKARAELILVDSASTDGTRAEMERFARSGGFPAQVLGVDRPGVGYAQNVAARRARGAILAFTDDDCRLADDYLQVLTSSFDPAVHHYGGGAILRGVEADDPRVACTDPDRWPFTEPTTIPPRVLITVGTLQGANLVFARKTFRAIGGFDEDLGPGGLMSGADVEIVGRANALGYTGLIMPSLRVFHHHGRRAGSPEAERTVAGYDRGRGGYYASLLTLFGEGQGWTLWRRAYPGPLTRPQMRRLERELRGAADYLRLRLEKPARRGASFEEAAEEPSAD